MNSLIEKIKSRGYWLITIRPNNYKEERISSLSDCRKIVEDCAVRLRGWDYPHIGRQGVINYLHHIESSVDWQSHIALWRMYQSGQFIHHMACIEDWLAEDRMLFGGPTPYSRIKPRSALEVISTLYQLTEIYMFTQRLAEKDIFNQGVKVRIVLNGTKDR